MFYLCQTIRAYFLVDSKTISGKVLQGMGQIMDYVHISSKSDIFRYWVRHLTSIWWMSPSFFSIWRTFNQWERSYFLKKKSKYIIRFPTKFGAILAIFEAIHVSKISGEGYSTRMEFANYQGPWCLTFISFCGNMWRTLPMRTSRLYLQTFRDTYSKGVGHHHLHLVETQRLSGEWKTLW